MATYNPQRLEMEAQMFWEVSRRFHELRRSPVQPADADKVLDHAEAVSVHTDWPPLRARCDAICDALLEEKYRKETA